MTQRWRMETRGVRDVMVQTGRTATLAEFLLARIAEDEEPALSAQRAWEGRPERWMHTAATTRKPETVVIDKSAYRDPLVATLNQVGGARHIARHDPARVLAECEAKRRIVEEHGTRAVASLDRETWGQPFEVCRRCREGERNIIAPCRTLLVLAQPYADHEQFRPEWRTE